MFFRYDPSPALPQLGEGAGEVVKKIYYEEQGSGEPLVFFPGWTMDHTVFRQQLAFFAKSHRTVLFDPPGCGQSSRFEGYSFELYTKVFAGILKHLNIDAAHLVGWSMGGEILIKYCAEHPAIARSLTLVCATPCFAQRPDWQHAMSLAAAKRFKQNLQRDPVGTYELFRTEALKGNSSPESARLLLRAGGHTDRKAGIELFDELLSRDERMLLSKVALPVYVIAGQDDAVCSAEASRYIAGNVEGARLDIFNTGHLPFLDKTELFNEKLLNFLTSTSIVKMN